MYLQWTSSLRGDLLTKCSQQPNFTWKLRMCLRVTAVEILCKNKVVEKKGGLVRFVPCLELEERKAMIMVVCTYLIL